MKEPGSPLRYPGGKAALSHLLRDLIVQNNLHDGVYAEPFAGGAGAAIELLKQEIVSHVVINDLDFPIYAFWKSAIGQADKFIDRIMSVPITMKQWERARKIYKKCDRRSVFETGFATFFLNRCNRSGIISGGGPIGGHLQTGDYKIDARFNRLGLKKRIDTLKNYASCITILNRDGLALLRKPPKIMQNAFVYIDPPYVNKGPELYFQGLEASRHLSLAELLAKPTSFKWVLTYDDAPNIRKFYRSHRRCLISLGYSAAQRTHGKEWLIFDEALRVTPELMDTHRTDKRLRVTRVVKPQREIEQVETDCLLSDGDCVI